ncbi:MAG: shikimate dehydrogenase [Campylobacterales bacterium]|nr:shikimate dehydrogenase [Campylobacterales bacterium]
MKKLFAIFGDPVSHSRSPIMHNMVFRNLNYDACYTRVHLKDGSKLRDTFLSMKLDGANITVPYKEEAFRACDEIRGFANTAGVVNTIINENGRLIGYNTDADGFIVSIDEFKDIEKVLIIGAGGTAKALALKFMEEDVKTYVLNRSEGNLAFFKDKVTETFTWNGFKSYKFNLVVNTTSAGLSDECLPAPIDILEDIFKNSSYAADAIYGKTTPFIKMAQNYNLLCKDGSDMLLGQGVLASQLFIDKVFDIKTIYKEMKKSFVL